MWLCLGTFPHGYALAGTDGVILTDRLQSGASVYIESADAWAFDPPTAFVDFDGVENDTALDGDDGFVAMTGLASGELNLVGLDAAYSQDQFGNDFTDRLLPSGATPFMDLDVAAGSAGTIWEDSDEGYGTGIYFETDPPLGRVICQSWEFGGYQGDQAALASLYATVLPVSALPFMRGNCNIDASTNIADAIFILGFLFPVGDPPVLICPNACDANNDGGVNIADAVSILAALFGMPTVPLVEPFPGCGVDLDDNNLPCDSFSSCP